MKKLLITAFEPFGGNGRNSALDTLNELPSHAHGFEIVKAPIPVVYDLCGEVFAEQAEAIPTQELAAVLCLGLAEGRGSITPEYAALNVSYASAADNSGRVCTAERILPDAPDAYFSTLPVLKIAEAVSRAGVPASPSFSAGTYVCNHLLFRALHWCRPRGIPCGFLHLPLSYEIAAAEHKAGRTIALPQKELTAGVLAAVGCIAEFLSSSDPNNA